MTTIQITKFSGEVWTQVAQMMKNSSAPPRSRWRAWCMIQKMNGQKTIGDMLHCTVQ